MIAFSASKFTKNFDCPYKFKLLLSLGNDVQFFVGKYSIVMKDGYIISEVKAGLDLSFSKILKGKKKGNTSKVFTQKVGAGNLFVGFV